MFTFIVVLLLSLWVAGVFHIIILPLLSGKLVHILLLVIAFLLIVKMRKSKNQ